MSTRKFMIYVLFIITATMAAAQEHSGIDPEALIDRIVAVEQAQREKINDVLSSLEGREDLDSEGFLLSKVIAGAEVGVKQDMIREESDSRLPDATSLNNAFQQSRGLHFESISPNRSSARFRDWNPDIKVARRAGVSIQYSSRSNEVRCPELNLSSRHVEGSRGYVGPRVRLTSQGPVATSGLSDSVSSFFTSSSKSVSSDSKTSDSGSESGGSSEKSGKVKKK